MYHIVFYEAGKFLTQVGGELHSLGDAIKQMESLAKGVDARPATPVLGVHWLRGGITDCAMFVVNQWGEFIRDANSNAEDQ